MLKKIKDLINKVKSKKAIFMLTFLFFTLCTSSVFAASTFNSDPLDKPLRGLNYTQNPSSGWLTSLSGANPGDDLRFNVYYHNASSEAAQNTQITLNLSPSGESSSFTANAQIAATGFDTYTSNMPISLTSSQSLAIISTARWFHNYDGSNFEITDIPVNVSGSIATFNLGTVNPGYSGNDGYVEFFV
ncbi:MAG: hypothetical protein PHY30_01240, partial [Candidatus Pacebacteria bacterium]|nr:hypothetical protein [Candidatus Paceibacterota bacterium]